MQDFTKYFKNKVKIPINSDFELVKRRITNSGSNAVRIWQQQDKVDYIINWQKQLILPQVLKPSESIILPHGYFEHISVDGNPYSLTTDYDDV